jgi:hypothetical protein
VAQLSSEFAVRENQARLAFAVSAGSLTAAREYLQSEARRTLRHQLLEKLRGLAEADPLDIIEAARDLAIACRVPLDELKLEQERKLIEGRDLLSKGALTALEQRQKRELTAAERKSVSETLQYARSWLRDLLLVRNSRAGDIVNTDEATAIERQAAKSESAAIVRALTAVDEAERQLHYNVSVQSLIESLLLTLRIELG